MKQHEEEKKATPSSTKGAKPAEKVKPNPGDASVKSMDKTPTAATTKKAVDLKKKDEEEKKVPTAADKKEQ